MGLVGRKLKLKNEGRSKTRKRHVLLCFCVDVGGEGRKEKKGFLMG